MAWLWRKGKGRNALEKLLPNGLVMSAASLGVQALQHHCLGLNKEYDARELARTKTSAPVIDLHNKFVQMRDPTFAYKRVLQEKGHRRLLEWTADNARGAGMCHLDM